MRKMKLLGIVLVVFTLMLAFAGCGSKKGTDTTEPQGNQTTQTQNNTNTSSTTLKIVGEENYAPISFEQNGEVKGISPDIIREAFKRIGYDASLQVLPWKRAQEMVKNGDADALFSPYKNAEREQIYSFPSVPLMEEQNVFMVRKDSEIKFDGDVTKLSKYTIGTVDGYIAFKEYVDKGQAKVDYSGNMEQAIDKMLNNRGVDLVYNTNYIMYDTLKKMGKLDQVKELKPAVVVNPSYLAFTKKRDFSELIQKFEKALTDMKADGTYQGIIDRYTK